MCGIFGYSGKQGVDPLRLRYLATENQLRGEDSTGVYGNHLYKKAKSAKSFVFDFEYEEAIEGACTIIGHTRKATMGAKTDANAHPFEIFKSKKHEVASVVGTHNGMIFEQTIKKLVEKYGFEQPNVDSELIYQMLVELNFDYDEALSQVEGAMALAFVRPDHPEHLYLYHRESRPLHIGYTGSNLYYSSEAQPLWLAGCDTVEALDTDKLYIFKKGTLVEVSDVKKPLITTIKEDQTLTGWLTNAATYQEKIALGLPGVTASQGNATTHRQTGIPFETPYMRATGGRNGAEGTGGGTNQGSEGSLANIFRGSELTLLQKIDPRLYHFELLNDPKVGKFYHSGHIHSSYLVFELVATHDISLKLPAWFVKLKDRQTIYCTTSHNGIGVLEIPGDLCDKRLKLQIFNPLQPSIVYEVSIVIGESGRVVEVALYIPFQETEEKVKKSKVEQIGQHINNGSTDHPERLFNTYARFSSWWTFIASHEFSIPEIPLVDKGVSGRSIFQVAFPLLPPGTRVQAAEGSESGVRLLNARFSEVPVYDKKTDILNMDKYTAGTATDELNNIVNKAKEALSSVDEAGQKSQQTLASALPFLEYLSTYFSNRFDAVEEEEMGCNCE